MNTTPTIISRREERTALVRRPCCCVSVCNVPWHHLLAKLTRPGLIQSSGVTMRILGGWGQAHPGGLVRNQPTQPSIAFLSFFSSLQRAILVSLTWRPAWPFVLACWAAFCYTRKRVRRTVHLQFASVSTTTQSHLFSTVIAQA